MPIRANVKLTVFYTTLYALRGPVGKKDSS